MIQKPTRNIFFFETAARKLTESFLLNSEKINKNLYYSAAKFMVLQRSKEEVYSKIQNCNQNLKKKK